MAREKRKYRVDLLHEFWDEMGSLVKVRWYYGDTQAPTPEKAVNNIRYRLGLNSQYDYGGDFLGAMDVWSWVVMCNDTIVLDTRCDEVKEWMEQQ